MEALPDRKYHILHADDSVSIRRLVADLLKKEGRFDVTQANDGEEAWNLLLRYKQQAEDNNIPISIHIASH